MTKLLKVLKVEVREQTTETVVKSKRHEYARGGYKLEETIRRVTTANVFAQLECGHWREEHGYGAVIGKAERLTCRVCDQAAWELKLDKIKKLEDENENDDA